ncbi:hypothetical protein COV19_06575 [Candidatus Woesearchaeota archaeon CG10_big_fil_rev_8_21_14_0_10_44_13]|nr:MAG: hypothetical protein COV19_06575 [Candidatus Woesearchaeota archaeon CG10_big_fil_rev_8_21_14_0_10_44_13]
MNKKTEVKNLPEAKFRAGAICATVWKNTGNIDGKETSYKTVSFERGYKDKDGQWKSTTSLRVNDLPRAEVVLKKAYEYLVLKDQGNGITEEVVC